MSDPRQPDDAPAPVEAAEAAPETGATNADAAARAEDAVLLRAKEEGPRDVLEQLKFQEVVVWANAITYRGMLLGADDEELYLKTSLRYVSVPMERITKIAAAGASDLLNPLKHVDASFYRDDEGEPSDAD